MPQNSVDSYHMRLETWGQREPRLSAVRLWKKSLPFLLSFLGIFFMFVDFVFAQLGSLLIVNKDKSHPTEEALAMISVFAHKRTYSETASLLETSSK